LRQGEQPSPAEYRLRFPDHGIVIETAFDAAGRALPEIPATLERALSVGGATRPDAEATLTYAVEAAAGVATRFAILRPHAKGGLGQVSVALDAELNREVALKELRPERAEDPASRARFLLEAEITGRLEHPGVVPVYGLGYDAQGRPFYAMRFVRGEDLKEAIERFHAAGSDPASHQDPHRGNLELRQLLNRFVAVCNVMAYAHSRGVIHRDLKPANILLGPYGETLVVDWGLAKIVGRGEAAAGAGGVEATLQPASGSGSGETMPGTALGTPAYMSPEQAQGRLERVGPLSDVYSLGATLYCLLTGKPPIDQTDVAAALGRVERGDFSPPRAVLPGVPRGLEAICLKAMALQPQDRYGSARALAEDLEHWMADEPIAAAPDPVLTRLARWGRRHKTLAAGIGALLLTAVAALAIGIVLIGFEQARTRVQFLRAEANLAVATQERQRADDKAREADQRAEFLRRQDYFNRINIALREIENGNIALAESLLFGCPADLRGWEWHYTMRSIHRDSLTLSGHQGLVLGLAFSPDSLRLACGAGRLEAMTSTFDRAGITLWDIAGGQGRQAVEDIDGSLYCLAFSPDGRTIAAGGAEYPSGTRGVGWLTLRDASTGRPRWTGPPEPGVAVIGVAFAPDGKTLAVGYGLVGYRLGRPEDRGWVRLWDVDTGKPLGARFGETAGGVRGLAFHRDGRRIAVANAGNIEIWDSATRSRLQQLPGQTCVTFSPDGKLLATGSRDNGITLRDAKTWSEIVVLRGHKDPVSVLAFSPDGALLATVHEDTSVWLWEVAARRERTVLRGHVSVVCSLAFSPDGRWIAAGSTGEVKLWDMKSGPPAIYRGHEGWVSRVSFRRDGRRVLTESRNPYTQDNTTRIWNPDTGEEDRPQEKAEASGPRSFLRGGSMGDYAALSPDGLRIAEPTPRLDIEVKDTIGREVLCTLRGHTAGVSCTTFSPDGQRIASASDDRTTKVWDSGTGQELLTLRGHSEKVLCMAFSPEGSRLISGSSDKTARIWDATPLPADVLNQVEARMRFRTIVGEQVLKEEMIKRIQADPEMSEPVRAAVLAIAGRFRDDPELSGWASLQTARYPGKSPAEYAWSLRMAEFAVGLAPNDFFTLTARGIALYRVGRYEDAVQTLRRADPLTEPRFRGPIPHVVAFLAMALHKLGRHDEALTQLDRLRVLMKKGDWVSPVWMAFLHEAEALMDARPPTKPRGK
jgi:WD40 repeat protein/tRNA A-37 threonylcarbamoyl transferase component Bud32